MADPRADKPGSGEFFAEFEPVSYDQWKEAAEASLKGAPFEKKVFTKTYEGVTLRPMYWPGEIEDLPQVRSFPGFYPYLRGTSAGGHAARPWGVAQRIGRGDPASFNQAARHDLDRGQTVLNVGLDGPTLRCQNPGPGADGVGRGGLSAATLDDWDAALEHLHPELTPLRINAGASPLPLAGFLGAVLEEGGRSLSEIQGVAAADPIGRLAVDGSLPCSLDAAYDDLAAWTAWADRNQVRVRTVLFEAWHVAHAGGNAVWELAAALAAGVEYLRALTDRDLDVDRVGRKMTFGLSLGANFFMEMAKIRAGRMLWARIVDAFGGGAEAQKMHVHGRTSSFTKTRLDPYVNMLRNTTEALAGVLATVDSLEVVPFDEPIRGADEFARRVSRNLQLLLRHECHGYSPIDPAGGSWYVETLTDQVAERAWGVFQEIEKRGGLVEALGQGFVQDAVRDTAEQRRKNLARRKDQIVGNNVYANLEEKPPEPDGVDYQALAQERARALSAFHAAAGDPEPALERLAQIDDPRTPDRVDRTIQAALAGADLEQLFAATSSRPGDRPQIRPIDVHRLTEPFEELRAAAERHLEQTGARVKAFLANMGPVSKHKARADFSAGFFQVGGFEVESPMPGFDDVDAAVDAAVDSGAPIVVICSTDQDYPELVPDLTRKIKERRAEAVVVLAGKPAPEHEDAYRQAGLDAAIHIGADALAILTDMQKRSGIR
jgi:methylmalonyl-CoA mutase